MKLIIENVFKEEKEKVDIFKIKKIYCCGITPYDRPHIGHLRVIYEAIIVKKLCNFFNKNTKIAINWTDIDDKIINTVLKMKKNASFEEI